MPATMTVPGVPTIEEIKTLLQTNARARERALIVLYERQTADEQTTQRTVEHNGRGFTGWDAEMLSSFAMQVQQNRFRKPAGEKLTARQHEVLVKRLPKYAKQLREAAITKGGAAVQPTDAMNDRALAALEAEQEERAMQRIEGEGDRAQTRRDAERAMQRDAFAECVLCHGDLTVDTNVGGEVEERPCPRCVSSRR